MPPEEGIVPLTRQIELPVDVNVELSSGNVMVTSKPEIFTILSRAAPLLLLVMVQSLPIEIVGSSEVNGVQVTSVKAGLDFGSGL